MCPDVSSPNEQDYDSSVIGKLENGGVIFDQSAFVRLSNGSIHTIDKCRTCYARWNCVAVVFIMRKSLMPSATTIEKCCAIVLL